MEHTTKRKIATEMLIAIFLTAIAYILATLFSDSVYDGMSMIKVQGIKHYLHHGLFRDIEYSYFFRAVIILYCTRLTVWAVSVLVVKQQSPSLQNNE